LNSSFVNFFKRVLFVSAILLFASCSGKGTKQSFANDYYDAIKAVKNRADVVKRGQDAIIAYRRSGFMDVDNAERAKDAYMQSIAIDSVTLRQIDAISAPNKLCSDMLSELKMGISSMMQGHSLYAFNYGRAKDQNIEQRKGSIMNVTPALKQIATGLNENIYYCIICTITFSKSFSSKCC
jgi:hypothetical protein